SGPTVAAVAVASQQAPHVPRHEAGWERDVESLLDDAAAEMDDDVVRAELRELLRPPIEADVRAFRRYAYEPAPPLTVPISAFVASEDHRIGHCDPSGWARHTTKPLVTGVIDGDHLLTGAAWSRLAAAVGAVVRA